MGFIRRGVITKEKYRGRQKTCSPYFACFGESFPDLAVASTVAGCDEVSDATALQEGGRGDRAVCAEDPGEGDHLHQAETNHCCLGVVAKSQAITETCPNSYNVLQQRERGDAAVNVLHTLHVKVFRPTYAFD